MLRGIKIVKNSNFVGRIEEIKQLHKIRSANEASIILVMGRRRVGKTELVEQFFINDIVLKFEGIQTKTPDKKYQIHQSLQRINTFTKIIKNHDKNSWTDFFYLLDDLIKTPPKNKKKIVLFFEEVQWLTSYQDDFFSELKPLWDDRFRHYKHLHIVICGSSPSFIAGQLLSDKPLYMRSPQYLFHLKPFDLYETKLFMGKKTSNYDIIFAQVCIGGIVEYLKKLKTYPSVLIGLAENSFKKNCFFLEEFERIFVSSMSTNRNYKKIIEYLANVKYASRESILKRLKIKSGGGITEVLNDLESCLFIEKYIPIHLKLKETTLSRYRLKDEYLHFYYRFIAPIRDDIEKGKYHTEPLLAIKKQQFNIFLGFNFERWCRSNSSLFAKHLGFDRIGYNDGPLYGKGDEGDNQQIDLVFIREDRHVLICEIKWGDSFDLRKTSKDCDQKIEYAKKILKLSSKYIFEKVLISSEPVDIGAHTYFDHIITLDNLFKK
ncbi:MAG: ATP-binding protein [Oligoflexia bacterium]|nr:ATP-binding protein [Oligoflexia bacterium]